MKRTLSLMLTLILVLMLTACSSGPDRQPALDAYEEAAANFDAAANIINENIDLIDPQLVEECQQMSELLRTSAEQLENNDELTQENLDELTAWFADVSSWSVDTLNEIETGLAELG